MKVFVSFKFTWLDEEELNQELSIIKSHLNHLWIDNFISFFDGVHNCESQTIMEEVFQHIRESDFWMVFINHPEKSEWMLLEIWIMQALQKDFVIFVKDEFKDNFFLSYSFAKDVIKFKDMADFKSLFMQYFGLKLSRQEIDRIDKEILINLKKRFDMVKRLWKYKIFSWESFLQNKRWAEVLEKKKKLSAEYWLDENLVEDIWKRIHKSALDIQQKN